MKVARQQFRALLPYSTSADVRSVAKQDLLQVIWYAHKAPRYQYQVWRRSGKDLSFKQFTRPINGVNAVRVYYAVRRIRLDELLLLGGKGVDMLARVAARTGLPLRIMPEARGDREPSSLNR